MKTLISVLLVTAALLAFAPFSASAGNSGVSNGKPFQQLQAAIDAEEAARVAADQELQAQLDAQGVLLVDLEGRVVTLEDLNLTRSVT